MTTSASAVQLQVAANILDGTLPITGVASARAGAWVARSALEQLVDELLDQRSFDVGGGTMRSRLICLSVAYADDPDRIAGIAYAWDQLSLACHHQPTSWSRHSPRSRRWSAGWPTCPPRQPSARTRLHDMPAHHFPDAVALLASLSDACVG